jgi:hypothetical protein
VEPVLDDLTAADNEIQTVTLPTKHGNILERVPVDQQKVGECSWCHHTKLTGLPYQLGIRDCCRAQNVEGRLNGSA